MPSHGRKVNEKPKNLKKSISRLLKELKPYRILIYITLILAALSSVLAIASPDRLSSLVDKISSGLVIDSSNMEKLGNKVTENLQNIDAQSILNSNLTKEEKDAFQNVLMTSTKDNLAFNILSLSDNTKKLIFKEIIIDNTKISSKDQAKYLETMITFTDYNDAQKMYKKIDELPKSVQKIIKPKMDLPKIKVLAIILFSLYFLSALFNYIMSLTMTHVSNHFAGDLRKNISKKINRLPLNYFDRNQKGDLLSRVTNDIDTISQSMNQSIDTLVSSITLFIGTIIMMFVTNYIMAITAIVSSLFGFAFMALILGKSQKYFNDRQKYLGQMNGHIEEVYSGLKIVKTYNGKDTVNEKFNELNEKVYESSRKSQFMSGLMGPLMGFIGNFGYVAVCIVGGVLAIKGNITFGVIIAFITYVRLFTSPLTQIGQAMTSVQSAAAASERVFEFLDEEEMVKDDNLKERLDRNSVKGSIEFKNVEFIYDGNDKPTIKNFSAEAKPGQKIAIVGPTGAGKTTIVNLLMKFYEINKGSILIDGKDTKNLSRNNIHDLFTMVLQDTWLFEGTIKENIIYNRKNISDEKVEDICKTVGLDHFIKSLPKGYDTLLKDSDSMSSGQRQLLTIARAMVENDPFLILDEATSNVDTRTEELVQKAMDKLTKGKTSFIIAHRLSTIKNADLILVMKDGNIIEQGNHEDLLKKNGFYADLYNSQFEL